MKNILLVVSLVLGLSACSEKRESDISKDFAPGTVQTGTLQAFPSNQTTNENTPLSATVPFVPATNTTSAPVFSIITQPTNGSVSINSVTGAYNYVPNPGYSGTDSFVWQVQQNGNTATSTVNINVIPDNSAPVAVNSTVTGNEDSPITGTASATDVDGDSLTYTLVTQPQHGTIVFNPNGTFTYTPNANYFGLDSFTFKANDGQLDSNVGTVALTVSPVNDAPVANNSSVITNEDSSVSGNLSGSDVDGNTLTYAIVTNPSNGSVIINSTTGAYTYTPNSNYSGPDSFTFKVNDGVLNSNVATVSITVNPTNDAPIALASNFVTNEDTAHSGVLNAVDGDGDLLTYTIISAPTKGVIVLTNANLGTFVYTPNNNQTGTDSFTFKVNDGQLDSNIVTVSVQINPVNDAPVALNSNFSVDAGSTHNGQALSNDVDTPPAAITYSLVTQPTKGVLTFNSNGSYSYVADLTASGTDSFTFKANDGQVDSNVGVITVYLNAVNQAPIANNSSKTVPEDGTLSSVVSGTDPEMSTLVFSVVTPPTHGSLTFNSDGTYTYIPSSNFNGSDSFTFKSNDGQLDSNIGTVSLTVTPINDIPVAVNGSYTINEEQTLTGTLVATDVDGNALTYSITTQPTNGTVSLVGNNFTYTPNANFNGVDSFNFKANDGTIDSNIATVSIQVNGQNDAPIVANNSFTILEDTVLNNNIVVTDPDGPSVGPWTIVTAPTKGTVVITNTATGAFTYTPNLNQNGADSFQVKVSDSIVDSNIATISINITPVNDAPVAFNGSFSVNQGQSYSDNLQATDVDSTTLTYSIVTAPTKGTVSLNSSTGAYTYTANLLSTGSDSFTFRANDGSLNSNIATISINLNIVNIAPISLSQSLTTPEDTNLSGQLQSSDLNGDTLTYLLVTQPMHGSVTVNPDGTFTYVPQLNYNGSDSFTFKTNDAQLDSNIATITLSVTPVNDAPVALSQSFPVSQSIPFSGQVSATDVDADSLNYSLVSNPTKGSITFNNDGTFTYTAGINSTGSDTITFKANDGQLDSNIATITFQINGFNQTPVANNLNLSITEDQVLSSNLSATDANISDTLTYLVVTQPLNGTVTVNSSTGAFVYTPNQNYHGSDSFTYKANDGTTDSNIATVAITITPVNDAPVSNNLAITTNEDVPYSGVLNSTDVENSPLTYSAVSQPQNGTLVVNSATGAYTYTPNSNYFGADSFTYKANDGQLDSNISTVTIQVVSQNDLPVANNATISNGGAFSFPVVLTATDADGDTLTYTILTQPTNGTISGTAPNLTFTPNSNTLFTDSFTFKVNDGTGDSNIATITINYTPVAPNAVSPIVACVQVKDNGYYYAWFGYNNTNAFTVNIPVGANNQMSPGPANQGQPTSFAVGTTNKVVKINNIPQSVIQEWELNGLTASADIQAISCNEQNLNNPPLANNQSVNTLEEVATTITLTGSDVDGDIIGFQIETAPQNGTVTIAGNLATYTPNLNFNGVDSFTFKTNDGISLSNLATVTVNVTPVNDAPVANNLAITVNEDVVFNGNLVATDVDGDNLTYTLVTSPNKGTVVVNPNGSFSYTPNTNENGSDSFTYKANDGSVDSNIATVSITIDSINDTPIAQPQTVAVVEDIPKNITLIGTDSDGDALTYTIVTAPTNGVISGTGSNIIYTPNSNFNGSDSFTFKVNDGSIDSNVATVSLTVSPVNDAPIAQAQTVAVVEDTPKNITLVGTDVDGNTLTYTVVTQPTNGVISGTGSNIVYTPNSNFNGVDSFTFKVNDGIVDSNIATVSLNVSPVNDAPVAQPQTVAVIEDTPKNITLVGTDVDGNTLTYSIVAQPTNGTLTVTGSSVTYTPNSNFNGSDSFTFKVNDGTIDSNIATVSLNISPVNDAPGAQPQTVAVIEDTPKNIILVGNDSDGDTLVYTIVSQPLNGTLIVSGSSVTYTPNSNFNGTDSFTFKVNDGTIDSNVATISLNVSPVNDAPIAQAQTVAVVEDTPKNITLVGTDVDGNTLTYSIVTAPLHGTITGTGANITYTPALNYSGTDSFTFKVNDGTTDSNIATVSLTVSPVNDAPVAQPQTIAVVEDTPKAITLVGTDVDGNTLTYSIVSQPTNGTLTITGASVVYTPALNYSGTDSFTFKVNDGTVDSNVATISLNISAVNDAPIAQNQNKTTNEDTLVTGTLVATDPDSAVLTYSIVTQPQHGTVVLVPLTGIYTYTPNSNYSGPDSFTFKANDGTVDSNIATVSITVTPINDAPVANSQTLTSPEDTVLTGTLVGTDVEGNALTYSIVAQPANGVVTVNSTTGAFSYTPNLNFNGLDNFTFRVNDGTVNSNTATVTINVTPVNDAPVVQNHVLTLNEQTSYSGSLVLGTDADSLILTYNIVSVTGGCTATLLTPLTNSGTLTTPAVSAAGGTCVVTYNVSDGVATSANGTLTVTVLNVNNAPIAQNQTVTVTEDVAKTGTLVGTDSDAEALTYTVITNPTKGTVTVNSTTGAFTYTPNSNQTGADSFTFKVNDGLVDSNVATVSINITAVNDAPIALSDNITTNEDTAVSVVLVGTDVENSPLTYTVITQPSQGTLSGTAPLLTYTPPANYFGVVNLTFKVNDGQLDSNVATITINVNSVNDLPIASNTSFSTPKNTAYNSFVVATDVETASLTYAVVSQPQNGTLTFNTATGGYTYTPSNNFVGSDSFTFRANDGVANSNTATVSITVFNPNQAPIAQNASYQTQEDTPYGGNMQAQDSNGDQLTYTVVTQPQHGTLVAQSNGTFVYTPNSNYFGSDSFTFKANDGTVDSNIATVSLTVNSVNDIPVANPQSVTVNQNSTNNTITLTGSDVESTTLTYSIVAQPQHGTITLSGNTASYTPTAGYFGADTFTFKVNDGSADSNVATVSITVNNLFGWCDSSFAYSNKLMINNQDQGALTNFPVMVKLNSSRVNYADFKAGGADLRFYDSSCNLLSYEIERWNTSGDSVVWVKVPTIAANANTSFIWMLYGNSSATDAQNKNAVWDSNYKTVYHLEEISGLAFDSTVNANNLTSNGSPIRNVSGRVAGGEFYDSVDDGLSVNSSASLSLNASYTLESWVYVTEYRSNSNIIEKQYDNTPGNIDYGLYVVDGYPHMRARGDALQSPTRLDRNKWYHMVATFNTSTNTCTLYVDGVQKATSTSCTANITGTGNQKLYVGTDQDAKYFHGGFDEVRVSNSVRDINWIRAQHLTMTDGMISYGSKRNLGDNWNHALMTIKTNNDDGRITNSTLATSGQGGIIYQGFQSWGYYRFQLPASIPANAVIKKATLRLYGRDNTGTWTNQFLTVRLQNTANASSPNNGNQAPGQSNAVPLVTPIVSWGNPAFTNWLLDDWNNTPDLKPLFDTLKTNQSGLTVNNYVQLWIGRGNNSNTTSEEKGSEDNAFDTINHGQLMIEWE